MKRCKCMKPPFNFEDYDTSFVGIDEKDGRFAEVSLEKCKACNSLWLRYFFEYESDSSSGRWFKGVISEDVSKNLTPSNATSYLKELPWHFSGGSFFFHTNGRKKRGPVLL